MTRTLINLSIYKQLFQTYSRDEIWASLLTGFLFFFFPASLAIALIVNFIMLNFYRFYFLYGLLYIVLVVIAYYASHVATDTLKHYKDDTTFDYRLLQSQMTVIISFITLSIFIAILLIFF